jgi:uncharacterized BrkB/YihY/UPF0761 family membrane protein
MAQSRRINARATPQRSISVRLKQVPWVIIAVLILALILILALWGKLPSQLRLPHHTPPGNSPGSSLAIDNSLYS